MVLTLVMTWPVAAGIARDVPGDLGDSLLNMWILGWGAEMWPRVLTGEMSVRDVWNANIFHPEPLALGLSEHLFAQVLQILPIYHLTGNLILCYNLLFLSTFALSAFGMYLLVRAITGHELAAIFAGLVYGFTPFRAAHIAHIQILSSQWMPFALYGIHRFIHTLPIAGARFRPGTLVPLVGGSAALIVQNWSCGYHLLYFAPFVPLFVVHQMVTNGRARDWQMWLAFAVAALFVVTATWPFLSLYLETRSAHAFGRPYGEILALAADVHGYLTASEWLKFSGWLRAFFKPEGEVFLGVVPVVIGVLGAAVLLRRAWRSTSHLDTEAFWRRVVASALAILGLIMLFGLVDIMFTGGFVVNVAAVTISATNANRSLVQLVIVVAALVTISPRARKVALSVVASPIFFALLAMLLAMWLSLGPVPRSAGLKLQIVSPYMVLYEYLPGFDALRAVARYAMVAALFLALFAGTAAAAFTGRRGARVVVLASLLFLIEAAFLPMPVNLTELNDGGIRPRANAPAVYQRVAQLPDRAVIAEFPFGANDWELRAVYYSTVHWKRIVNGYSGGFPNGYLHRKAVLQRAAEMPDRAWAALVAAQTTHVIVHEKGWPPHQGVEMERVKRWLANYGAREIGRYGSDVLYEMPGLKAGSFGN